MDSPVFARQISPRQGCVSGNCNACLGAIATGGCWTALAATVPGFRPVEEEHVDEDGRAREAARQVIDALAEAVG